jgi:hypothetical protein
MPTKITVIYDYPQDPDALEAGYPDQLALAAKMPGIDRLESSKVWPKEDGAHQLRRTGCSTSTSPTTTPPATPRRPSSSSPASSRSPPAASGSSSPTSRSPAAGGRARRSRLRFAHRRTSAAEGPSAIPRRGDPHSVCNVPPPPRRPRAVEVESCIDRPMAFSGLKARPAMAEPRNPREPNAKPVATEPTGMGPAMAPAA